MTDQVLSFDEWLTTTDMPDGKRRILRAAVSLFAQNGFHATSTAAITKEAGLSDATMFKHFKNKNALLDAILAPLLEQLVPNVSEQFVTSVQDKATTINDVIAFIVSDRWSFMQQNNEVIQVLVNEALASATLREHMISEIGPKLSHITTILQGLMRSDSSINPQLTGYDLLRIIAGQLMIHFMSQYKFQTQLNDETVLANVTLMTQQALR